ncbi:MAG: hypothetical protein KA479_09285 [Saprospiraceae bacterium]|nr:hypothetical protein [Saprospiraceae bacterium]
MIKIAFLFLLSTSITYSCSSIRNVPYTRTAEVTKVKATDRTITVHARTQAGTLGQAINYSERLAMENLLFRGIPQSTQELPMISDEYEATSKYKTYFDWLLSDQGYRRFYIESSVYQNNHSEGIVFLTQQITIDIEALRKDLEQHNVIRNFGL